ncbi:uncharacterized protein [Nicotiana tomentosiformis]|uniref:uncharacterized protein n=1 Tax=Nicotiana tomentosiformis TaxID=4098 RepID=UPI00388CD6A2
MALLTPRFQRAIRKGSFLKKGSSSKSKLVEKTNNNNNVDGYYKCGKKDHFIKDCPLWELEWKKKNYDKGKQQNKDRVPGRRMTNKAMDKIMKKAMAYIQSSSTDESDDDDESEDEDQSLMAKQNDSESEDLLALMENSDSDADEEKKPELSFQDIKDKIQTYSKNKLISLSDFLIDAYKKNDEKEQLMTEYASLKLEEKDLEISRESLEVFVVDFKDHILVLEDKKAALETENNRLLNAPNKGEEPLENELKETNDKLLVESKKVRILQENLDKTKFELEKNLNLN